MLNQQSNLSNAQFRAALPADRRQIRFLLRCCYTCDSTQVGKFPFWRGRHLGLGLLLALILHWLMAVGGLSLLLGIFSLITIAIAGWLNLQLFEDWPNYWVIEQNNRLIACARLTDFGAYTILSDVVVLPEQRQRGVGTLLLDEVCRLRQLIGQPIYLSCTPNLVQFYQRFGFELTDSSELSLRLQHELGLDTQPRLLALRLGTKTDLT